MSYAIPEYPRKESGVLLVVGSAPCLFEDVRLALESLVKNNQDFQIMAINEAAGALDVNHVATMHAEKMEHFAKLQINRGRNRGDFLCHCVDRIEANMRFEQYPQIDHFWNGCSSSATSAFAGVMMGLAMGFNEIVLCGCPMNGGDGYFNQDETDRGSPANPRFGFTDPDKGLIKSWKETVGLYAEEFGDRVFSMSGFTKQALGGPSWV